MDPAQETASAVDELRQIRLDARKARSVEGLRRQFDRLQSIRQMHVDDFDVQVSAAEAHQEVIERARTLRAASNVESEPFPEQESGAAEIPPEVPRLDVKSWQRALGLALFFTILVLAAFFYLIQSARRINFQEQERATASKAASPAAVNTAPKAGHPARSGTFLDADSPALYRLDSGNSRTRRSAAPEPDRWRINFGPPQ